MEGTKYDNGKLDWTLVPWSTLRDTVKVLMHGAHKYERNNWMNVMPRGRYKQALLRHVEQFQKEYYDEDSGLPHLAHIIVNAMFLQYFKEQPTCYIAGPIRGKKDCNGENFMKWEEILMKEGYNVVNPIRISERVNKMYEEPSWERYMKEDIKELVECDYIFMLDGWFHSKGAFLEHTIAESVGIKVMFEGEEKWQKKL